MNKIFSNFVFLFVVFNMMACNHGPTSLTSPTSPISTCTSPKCFIHGVETLLVNFAFRGSQVAYTANGYNFANYESTGPGKLIVTVVPSSIDIYIFKNVNDAYLCPDKQPGTFCHNSLVENTSRESPKRISLDVDNVNVFVGLGNNTPNEIFYEGGGISFIPQ